MGGHMAKANESIAVIPSRYFRWQAGVQFIESFPKRTEALRYARHHGYNLVVEYSGVNGPRFDVLSDPCLPSIPGSGSSFMHAWNALVSLPR